MTLPVLRLQLWVIITVSIARCWILVAFSDSYTKCTVGRILRTGIFPSQGPYQHKHGRNTKTSIPRDGFELTTPVFKMARTVHSFHSEATVSENFGKEDD
jgi:hypothetical protein